MALAMLAVVATVTVVAPGLETTAPTDPPPVGVLPTARRSTPPSTSTTLGESPSAAEPEPLATAPTTAAPAAERSPTTRLEPSTAELLAEDRPGPELRVPAKPPEQGQTAPLFVSGGRATGWNPCKTIHYVVQLGGGPPNGLALIREAVRRVEAATGLGFEYDGPTTTFPQYAGATGPVPDISEVFKPVFIGWATRQQTDIWAREGGDALGVASPQSIVFDSGDQLFVSGAVVLLPSTDVTPGFGPGATMGNVLLHELGHLVGLDHVDDPNELMQPTLTSTTRDGYGPGDRRGLYDLGSSRGCASSRLRVR